MEPIRFGQGRDPGPKLAGMQSAPLFTQNDHWRAIFWFSYACWAGMELFLILRDARAARGQKRDAGSRFAFFVLIPAGLFGAFFAPELWPFARIALPPAPIFYAAIGLIWAGIAFRLWAIVTLGQFFRTSVFVHEDHRLITSGPYRVLRHPSYTGSLITVTGIGLAVGNWLSLAIITGCAFLAYTLRMIVEEKALASHFGEEFTQHKRRTWAIIPFIW